MTTNVFDSGFDREISETIAFLALRGYTISE